MTTPSWLKDLREKVKGFSRSSDGVSHDEVRWMLGMLERVHRADGCVGTGWLRGLEAGPPGGQNDDT